IKGVAYRGSLKQYDTLVKGGSAAVLDAVRQTDLSLFARQDFFVSRWYDIVPMAYLDQIAADSAGMPLYDFMRAGAELQAQLDMNGVYKLLLRLFSPESALTKLASFSSQYFNFGKPKVELRGPRHAEVQAAEVPAFLADWFARATAYY